jgi:hypothetical protein
MKKRKSPEIINLPEAKLNEIKTRLESGSILEEDKKAILLILSTYAWLYRQLQTKKLGIQRLRNLFGFSTEKRSGLKKKDDGDIPPGLNGSSDATTQDDTLPGGNVTPLKKHLIEIQKKTMDD